MSHERLPVNIFNGVIPDSYVFLDNFDDDSKWVVVNTLGALTIGTGDVYGYFGKGINFSLANPGAIGVSKAERFVLSPPQSQNYIFGITLRANLLAYDVTAANYNEMAMTVVMPNTLASLSAHAMRIILRTYHDGPGGVYRRAVFLLDDTAGSTLTVATHTLGMVNTSPSHMPWYRLTVFVENNIVRLVKINGFPYSVSFPYGAIAEETDNAWVELYFQKSAVKSPVTWDIDQVWISETENRV